MEGSPAKKQKQTTPMAITPPPLKRSYAAVVRNNINTSVHLTLNKNETNNSNIGRTKHEKQPIIIEAGLNIGGNGGGMHLASSNINACNGKPNLVNKTANAKNRPKMPVIGEDVHPYLKQLEQALELEVKYRVPVNDNPGGEMSGGITSGMRDGSAHVLRCLKVWYDLPSDVFFNAISSIDRFLAKMKAQPKHLSCIAVAAFHLACLQHQKLQQEQHKDALVVHLVPEPLDLVNISQSRCSPSDLLRMRDILATKLETNPGAGPEQPITALTMLRLMFNVSRAAANHLGLKDLLPETSLPDQLLHQLEILACDSLTLQHRPAELALALLATNFQQRATREPGHSTALMGFISELQKYCNIPSSSFVNCLGIVVNQLDKYNSETTVAHRQRLVWKLSTRTLRHLRPTDKLRATLPTIKESSSNLQLMRSSNGYSNESLESLNLSTEDPESDREMDIEEENEEQEEFSKKEVEVDEEIGVEIEP
jgi:cyclin G2